MASSSTWRLYVRFGAAGSACIGDTVIYTLNGAIIEGDAFMMPASDDTSAITDNAPDLENNSPTDGNILHGGPVTVSGLGGTPYVLGIAGNPATFGFHPFTDTSIPANKPYYVQ